MKLWVVKFEFTKIKAKIFTKSVKIKEGKCWNECDNFVKETLK